MQNIAVITLLLVVLSSCYAQDKKSANSLPALTKATDPADTGIVYFSFDNGKHWKSAGAGLPQQLSIGLGGVAVSEKELGITTSKNGVYLYNTADSTWTSIPTPKVITDGEPGAMIFYNNSLVVGTRHSGVFFSNNQGKNWVQKNTGLHNITIRRFVQLADKLYVCTNNGVYWWNGFLNKWEPGFVQPALQVNGAVLFKDNIFLATSKGVYKKENAGNWLNILPGRSVHNISADGELLYAMTYDELLLSSADGLVWQTAQNGLPNGLYTFNVLYQQDVLLAGQWNGVYHKTRLDTAWRKTSVGLPENFAVTNLQSFNGVLVISTSERKLLTTRKPAP